MLTKFTVKKKKDWTIQNEKEGEREEGRGEREREEGREEEERIQIPGLNNWIYSLSS